MTTRDDGRLRTFASGATRDTAANKIDPEGFLDPLVVERFSRYMDAHRVQSDGSLRDSDNWQRGFTRAAIMKSLWRHFLDLWLMHRGSNPASKDARASILSLGWDKTLEVVLCAILFNVQAYLREVLLRRSVDPGEVDRQAELEAGAFGRRSGTSRSSRRPSSTPTRARRTSTTTSRTTWPMTPLASP